MAPMGAMNTENTSNPWYLIPNVDDHQSEERLMQSAIVKGVDHYFDVWTRSLTSGKSGKSAKEAKKSFFDILSQYEGYRTRTFRSEDESDDTDIACYFDWGWLNFSNEFEYGRYSNNWNIKAQVLGRERFIDLKRFIEENTFPRRRKSLPPKDGHPIKVLTAGMGGYDVTQLAKISQPLTRVNYEPSVVNAFEYTKKNLFGLTPNGRIAILDGPPGTGKTYMVRALITEAPANVEFVLLNTSMLEQLSNPSLLEFLIQHRGHVRTTHTPMVLVLEDADSILSKRQAKSMDPLSALLNLGDGIMGDALDIRVIATTNSSIDEFDSAVLRPGRLCSHVRIGNLSNAQAQKVATKLGVTLPPVLPSAGQFSLAEVYALVNNKAEE